MWPVLLTLHYTDTIANGLLCIALLITIVRGQILEEIVRPRDPAVRRYHPVLRILPVAEGSLLS